MRRDHSPRVRHPGLWSQMGLRKHYYKQSECRWWNFSWTISNPKRCSCESAALNMPANLENSTSATGLEKVSFHSNPKERQCQTIFKLLRIAHISYTSKLMLKILQARFQQYVNWELPDIEAVFRNSRGTRDQTASICWIIEKAREFQKNICFIENVKAFNCRKFLKSWEYQTTLPASWEICMQVKSNSYNRTWNN